MQPAGDGGGAVTGVEVVVVRAAAAGSCIGLLRSWGHTMRLRQPAGLGCAVMSLQCHSMQKGAPKAAVRAYPLASWFVLVGRTALLLGACLWQHAVPGRYSRPVYPQDMILGVSDTPNTCSEWW